MYALDGRGPQAFLPILASILALASASLTPRLCAADDDHSASRTIGDTTFLLPALQDGAFVLTEVGFRQGVNYQRTPNFPVTSFARFNLSWLEFEERLDLSIRITQWLAIYGQGVGTAAIGLDVPSLLFQGGGYSYSGKGGVLLRLYRSDATRTQISVRAYGGGGGGAALGLLDFFESVAVRAGRDIQQIAAQTTDVNQLPQAVRNELTTLATTDYSGVALVRSSSKMAGASLHLAQALLPPLTLQASIAVEGAWSRQTPFDPVLQNFVTLDGSDTTVMFDSVLSVRGNEWGIPLGISAEYAGTKTYRTLAGSSVYVPSSHYFGGGLFYTGRRGLEIGALFFTRRNLKALPGFGSSSMSDQPVGYMGAFVFRALW